MMFVRFVVGADTDHHKALTGVINAACDLRDDGKLSVSEKKWLAEVGSWFDAHLPAPPFKKRDWPDRAVAWFKDDARESIGHIWDLVALLREHGVAVRMLKSKSPGRILYEDEYQVIVDEWGRV